MMNPNKLKRKEILETLTLKELNRLTSVLESTYTLSRGEMRTLDCGLLNKLYRAKAGKQDDER